MLSEYFIDSCLTISCSIDQKDQDALTIFSSIKQILTWYKKEVPQNDIPNDFVNKLDILSYLVTYRLSHKAFVFSKFAAGIINGRCEDLLPNLESRIIQMEKDEISSIKEMLVNKRKLCEILSGKTRIEKLLADVETGNYIDDVEIIDRWEHTIGRNWTKIKKLQRTEDTESIQTLDLLNDDYSSVMDSIRNSYDPTNVMSTGYKSVDRLFPNKGFEMRRLYLIGGTSNVGKSMFITNLNYNAIDNNDGGGDYLYLTGENLISETLERLYCCITGTPHLEMVSKVLNDSDFNLKVEIKNTLTAKRSNIILKYFKSQRTTTADIRDYVDEAASGGRLKAVYLDYLDLLKSESRLEDTRLDLGEACNELKNIAIDYALPIISPTQLNKSGYDTELVPKLTSMSESMKKVDNSDFVLFLQPAPDPIITLNINGIPTVCKKVRMTILKNRNGETGESVFLIAPVRAGNIKIFNYRMLELTKFVKDINPNMVNDSNSPWD